MQSWPSAGRSQSQKGEGPCVVQVQGTVGCVPSLASDLCPRHMASPLRLRYGMATPAPFHSSKMPSSILSGPLLVLLSLCLTSPGEEGCQQHSAWRSSHNSACPSSGSAPPLLASPWLEGAPHPHSSSASQRVIQESPNELSETNPDRSHGAKLNALWASGEGDVMNSFIVTEPTGGQGPFAMIAAAAGCAGSHAIR